jgi:deazaflavin-dependent oxidoreductase (nitroreductase family)
MPLDGVYEPSTWDVARQQTEQYLASGGTEGTTYKGLPVIVLTMVGAKTGKLRKTPLMRVEHDGEYALVGSWGASPTHPFWYHNVTANPHVEVQDGPVVGDYDARQVFGDERTVWWKRAVGVYSSYASMQERTDREFPVFVLTPRR